MGLEFKKKKNCIESGDGWLLIIQYQQIQTAHFIVHHKYGDPEHCYTFGQRNRETTGAFFFLLFFQSVGYYYVDSSSFLAFIAVNGKTYRISKI